MASILPLPEQPALAIASSHDTFPVGRIFCVGRNYADHVREMGGDPDRGEPVFFTKFPGSIVPSGATVPYPQATADLHHEVELAVALSAGGADLAPGDAAATILGYAVALDMTRRDLQAAAKKGGLPWDMGKNFDRSCPCGALSLMPGRVLTRGAITLDVNGERRQTGDLGQMIWSVAEIVAALSRLVTLRPGDLVLTGTPAGVGPVKPGDRLEAAIEGVGTLDLRYRA